MDDIGPKRFEVDGVEYDSLEDIPREVRERAPGLFDDADHNGVPDLVEQALRRGSGWAGVVDGVEYTSLDDVPEPHRSELRAHLEAGGGMPRVEQRFEVNGTLYTSLDDVPEPYRTELRRLIDAGPAAGGRPGTGSIPRRRGDTASAGTATSPPTDPPPLVSRSRSPRAVWLVAPFVAVAVAIVMWLVAR